MKRIFYLLIFMSLAIVAQAQITVTNNNDSGAGSLRDAVATAAPGQTIDFSTAGPIVLTSGEILIDKDLTIDGGAGITISGNLNSRIFNITAGITTIKNLNFVGGAAGGGFGGAIRCVSFLNALNCNFQENTAEAGGAVSSGLGTLNFMNCVFGNNSSSNQGGAINVFGAICTITNCLFAYNNSAGNGGAIESFSNAFTTVTNCTFVNNNSNQTGGAIGMEPMAT
jgi:predicted outer membrane repeat protein